MAAGKKTSSEEIIDLTELIEKGGNEAPPKARKVEAQVHHDDSDIESLLADMDAGDTTPKSAPKKVDADEQLDMADLGGIDDLLESLDIPAQPHDDSPSTPLDDAVDDLMGNGKNNGPAKQPSFADDLDAMLDGGAPQKSQAPADDLDADLDDLFSSLNESPGEPAKKTQKAAPPKPAPQPNAAPQPKAAPNPVDDDLDDILSSLGEPPAPPKAAPAAPKAAPPSDFPDDLDDLLNGTEAPAAPKSEAPKLAPKAAQKPVPQKLLREADEAETKLRQEMTSEPAPQAAETSYAVTANLENLNFQARDLGQRLQNCETDLAKARQRIDGLEKTASSSASIEDLLRDGSSLHAGFANLIATSVGQVLQETKENGPDPQTLAKLQQIELDGKDTDNRLANLENRVAGLEQQGSEGKRIAEQVVEKIGALVQDGNDAAQRMETLENNLHEMLPQIDDTARLASQYDDLLQSSTRVSARIDALENRFGELAAREDAATALKASLDAVEQEALSLKGRLTEMEARIEEGSGEATAQAILRIDAIENKLGDLAKIDEIESKLGDLARIDEIENKLGDLAKIDEIENKLGDLAKIDEIENKLGDLAKIDEIDRKLASLEDQCANLATREECATFQASLDDARHMASTRIIELENKIGDLASGNEDDKLSARMDEIEQEAVAARDKLDDLESRFAALAQKNADSNFEASLEEVKNKTDARLAEVAEKIDALSQAAKDSGEIATRIDEIGQDAVTAKTRLAAFEERLANFADQAQLEAATASMHEESQQALDRIGKFEERLTNLEGTEEQNRSLPTRVAGVEQDALAAKSRLSAVEAKFGLVDARFESLATQDETEKASLDEVREAANARLDDLEGKLAGLEQGQAANRSLSARLEGVEQDALAAKSRLSTMETKFAQMASKDEANDANLVALRQMANARMDDLEGKLAGLDAADLNGKIEKIAADAHSTNTRLASMEGQLGEIAHLESADTALLAKIGSVEQDCKSARDDLEILEGRLGQLESGKDTENSIDQRLESISRESSSTNARLASLEEGLEKLSRNVASESSSEARIEALEQTVDRRIGDLQQKLAALEEISGKTAEIISQLQGMEKMARSVGFRMDAVESRLDNLEPRFNKEVEKAATSAVARVLREEISRLVADA